MTPDKEEHDTEAVSPEDEEGPTTEERRPRKMADPSKPSKEEVATHEITHLPYRNWCEVCVQGRGKNMQHRKGKQERGLPEIHMDYMFIGPKDAPGMTKTCLVIREAETRMTLAIMVPAKGRQTYVIDRVLAFLEEIGHLSGSVIVKSDQEASLKALVEDIGRARGTRSSGRWIVENSPVRSSQSNGVIERAVQSIEGQVRVLKIAVERRWKAEIPVDHPVLAWAVEYASFLLNRFEVGHDGKTAYERLKGKRATTLAIEFGEKVLWKMTAHQGGALGKLSSTWRVGVYLGVRGKSGELVVADRTGVWRTRTAQRKPFDERWDPKVADEINHFPWTCADRDAGDEAEEAIELKMKGEELEQEAAKEVPEVVPRNFYIKAKDLREHGYTSRCPGCTSIIRGTARQEHTQTCRKRLEELMKDTDRFKASRERIGNYLAQRLEKEEDERESKRAKVDAEAQKLEVEGDTKEDAVMQESASGSGLSEEERKRSAEVETDEGPAAKKLMTGAVDEEESDGEGEIGGDEEFERLMVEQEGKEELDPKQVSEAREEEIGELERRVYEIVDVEQCWARTGKKPIAVRWVDVRKPCGRYRSRLVAKDFKPRYRANDVEGLYASMPPLELVKLLIARAAAVGDLVMLIDVKKAHLYAPIEGDVYVDLPPERAELGRCAKLKFTLYGMRTAASSWEKEYGGTLNASGFITGKANGCSFYHRDRDVRSVVHGDDFIVAGQREHLKWTEERLSAKYPLQVRGILGPGPEDCKTAVILNRRVTWKTSGVEFEADPSHVKKLLKAMRMEECNMVMVPGAKEEVVEEDEVPLEGGQLRAYRSAVARGNYLAQDRPDIRYPVKELCRSMSRPTTADWGSLKRLCRYLKGRPCMVQRAVPTRDGVIEVFVDSDWAGCRSTRRSTSAGAMMAYGMCLKVWSTTQRGVARSSGEAELYAATKGMTEGLGLLEMCKDMGIELEVVVRTDSNACRGTCQRTGLGRLKHLEVEDLWAQEVVKTRRLRLERVSTHANPADLMTKHQPRVVIDKHMGQLGFEEV